METFFSCFQAVSNGKFILRQGKDFAGKIIANRSIRERAECQGQGLAGFIPARVVIIPVFHR
jgi:hypothetical protein